MIINTSIAISTSNVLLVPYQEHHVPTYHEWMKDEDIREATASEQLTLEKEYGMQRSWRNDADKLTFITCLPKNDSSLSSRSKDDEKSQSISAKKDDSPDRMVGDVNLFISEHEEELDEEADAGVSTQTDQHFRAIGELELMIASKAHQGTGLGRASLLAFLRYVVDNQEGILAEFSASVDSSRKVKVPKQFEYLRVKIHQSNDRSIGLFESIGLEKISEEPNYFGELELRLQLGDGNEQQSGEKVATVKDKVDMLMRKYGVEGFRELKYVDGL
ncbi:hypothetical protein L228DRAFT_245754 [Xylona heveae TC161]|uniref:N-acetyltransferase domain-containing protein n=1 Tax=Xylona heveae (strain CBS 132557 / TC161) TaxID=1328760 RepID=A0A165IDR0_XYLHT|nr:hypothetical protein L228DRAFT_245754 [Xylona heveae TC161]KZF24750.1 hypothetical protein L228DRAFT_245754 [Xylona heveae TC161]